MYSLHVSPGVLIAAKDLDHRIEVTGDRAFHGAVDRGKIGSRYDSGKLL